MKGRAEHRSRRALVRVAVLVVGLALLLWGADAAARVAAQSLIARDVQDATGSTEVPQVHVRGHAFLLQLLRGVYDEIDVTSVGLSSGPLRVERVESRLSDVELPFHDVLVRDRRPFRIGHTDQRATVLYSDLNRYLEATGRPFQLASGGGNQVEVTGALDVLDRHVVVHAEVSLTVEDGALVLTPNQIDTGSSPLSRVNRLLLAQRLSLAVPMDGLPFGNELLEVQPTSTGVLIHAEGRSVVVQP